jgi:hypothetical protein
MTMTLTNAISATARRIAVTDPDTDLQTGTQLQIDNELLTFREYVTLGPDVGGPGTSTVDTGLWYVERGSGAASHSQGATISVNTGGAGLTGGEHAAIDHEGLTGVPEAGGVTVNEQPVTNIVAPGATIVDGEATVLNGWSVEEDGGLFVDKSEDAEPPSSIIDALLPDDSRFRVRGTAAVLIDRGSVVEQVALDVQVPDDTTAPRLNVADDSNVGFFTILAKGMVQFGAATGATHILRVFDDEANVVFQIDTDGTVHILTGGTVVADL